MAPAEELKRLALRREFLQAQSDVLRLTLVQQSTRLSPLVVWGERCLAVTQKLKLVLPAVAPIALVVLLKNFKSLRKLLTRGALLLSLFRKGRDMAQRFARH